MLDLLFIGIGLTFGGGVAETPFPAATHGPATAPAFTAEDQTPTGKFTTAA